MQNQKSRPSIPEDGGWSKSVSSLEQKSPKKGIHTVTSVPEIGKYFLSIFFDEN